MRSRINPSACVVVVLAVMSVPAVAQAAQSGSNVADIVARMEQVWTQATSHVTAYSTVREYQLYGEDSQKANSDVMARVNFAPPDRKTFQILESKGSGRGESVVKRVLQTEAQLTESGKSELSRQNYKFTLQGRERRDGRDCYVLAMEPLRKEHGLINGKVWVDAETYRIHRVEGELVKSPSWWIRKTEIVRTYEDRAGLWLPVSTKAVADVRFLGQHTLSERQISLTTGDMTAMNRVPAKRGGARRAPAIVGAGVPLN